jgi:DUF2961 family protein
MAPQSDHLADAMKGWVLLEGRSEMKPRASPERSWQSSFRATKLPMLIRKIGAGVLLSCLQTAGTPDAMAGEAPARDLSWFLRRLRSTESLPELEDSHTALSSTWDRTGGNGDNADFKRIENDGRNILLDVDGPGCIHRIFTGVLQPVMADTRLQIFLDEAERPVFDVPVLKFFDDNDGPLPYPLVFHKSYPGILFPIPYARHCRLQLVNPASGGPSWDAAAWGNYWQVAYTTYSSATKVKSLRWPPDPSERQEMDQTCQAWLKAESSPPDFPQTPVVDKTFVIPSGSSENVQLAGCGIIHQMRVIVEPPQPEVLLGVRLQMAFDRAESPGVDVPLGCFFGNAFAEGGKEATSPAAVVGRRPSGRSKYSTDFCSMFVGAKGPEAYACFPMPFRDGAVLRFENRSKRDGVKLRVRLDVERREALPDNWGRFHVTWQEQPAATYAVAKFGPKDVPCHVVLDRRGRGKYIGVMLHIDWPSEEWWGEGDWIIWSDEDGWPPSYHGTGSEEYFNSGWCQFDRKAVSGFVTLRPGHPMVYSFHLNDAFQFRRNIRVVEEQMGAGGGNDIIRSRHPRWGSAAYWYALPAHPAESSGSMNGVLKEDP